MTDELPDHAAFLKGINLGKRRISNEELRAHFEGLGLERTAIFRASGNVVFSDPRSRTDEQLVELIETGLGRLLGYSVATFVRSRSEVVSIAEQEPFDASTHKHLAGKLQVGLLAAKPSPAKRSKALELAGEDDALRILRSELYWLPLGGVSDTALDLKALERLLGPMTVRTMGTIEQIAAKHFAA